MIGSLNCARGAISVSFVGSTWCLFRLATWLRGVPAYAFSLSAARRRGLRPVELRREGDDLVLELDSGQRARIRPAGADTLPELERWDTFYYLVLTAEDEADLDALWADSHVGRWE